MGAHCTGMFHGCGHTVKRGRQQKCPGCEVSLYNVCVSRAQVRMLQGEEGFLVGAEGMSSRVGGRYRGECWGSQHT